MDLDRIESRLTTDDTDAIDAIFARVAFAPDGTILRFNTRFIQLFDYEGWDLHGRNRSLLMPQVRSADEIEIDRTVFAEGQAFTGQMRQLKRSGTPFQAEVWFTPVLVDDGRIREIVMLLRDATGRATTAIDEAGQIAAINTSQAVIHFAMDGTILDANPLFLETMGYELSQIRGRHHRMFVSAEEACSPEYARFWDGLRQGSHVSGEFRRWSADGRAVWLRATYNPIFDLDGRPFKIVKYAVDVTPEKKQYADFQGQIDAIDKSQCVVTFAPDGTILGANRNFLEAVGYGMDELAGRHHRMFVESAYAHSFDYEEFWSDLLLGRHRSGEFRRIGKNGREVWFRAIYSPVLDHDGRPFKIVKYATAITREKLRQADHQGQIAAIHRSQSVVSFSIDGTILDANDNFLDLTGYRLSQVLGQHHSMFLAEGEKDDPAYRKFWTDLAGGTYRSGEFKRVGCNGREIWLQASYNPIFDMNGRPFKIVKNAVDVTEQKVLQGDYEGQIAAINKSQCVVSFDLDGIILDANDNFLRALRYDRAEVIGRHHRMFAPPAIADSEDYAKLWAQLRDGRHLTSKFRRIARDGSDVWIQASYNPIYDLNGRPFKIVKIATDITADVMLAADLSRAQAEVQQDAGTGLPNRLGLRRFLRQTLAETGSELALLYLDLDHFKPINDTFGHDVGDHVLKVVAARLQGEMAEGQMVARVGGDEFVVAVSGLRRPEAGLFAQRLIETVSRPIPHDGRHLEVGLSVGIALTPDDTLEEDELFRMADVALYRSKGTCRGTHTFYAKASTAAEETERHMAHEMRIGVKANEFQLSCVFHHRPAEGASPIIEARPEWNHPSLGCIGADRFIRVADRSGLVVPLGDWMVREGCRLALKWRDLTVSVPIYPKQIVSADLPGMLMLALRETGVDPGRLALRLERGSMRVAVASLRADIERVRSMGFLVVGESFVIEDDALDARAGWIVDRVRVDPRLRKLLGQRRHPLLREIAAIEGHEAMSASDVANLVFEIDRSGTLHSFLKSRPLAPETPGTLRAA